MNEKSNNHMRTIEILIVVKAAPNILINTIYSGHGVRLQVVQWLHHSVCSHMCDTAILGPTIYCYVESYCISTS